jgi:hypothetical protein
LFSGKGISQLYKEIKTMDINKVILWIFLSLA